MRTLFPLILLCFVNFLQAQITFDNAFPNLTFNYPVDIQNSGVSGDNRLFVVEQPGRIRVFQNQSNVSSSSLFLDITNKVNYTQGQEKGLLGLAFHPNYNQNGYFYVSYTGFSGGQISIVVERYSVSGNPNQANANSGCQILSFVKNQNASNHNGECIAFGPDGFLYISVGDGGGSGDPQGNAQNINSLFGKILRVNVNGPCPGYTIPSNNPFAFSAGRDEIYAYGLRNTWKMSWDFQTNRLWGADVGQSQFEEINIIQNGRNYGWNRFEAFSTFNASAPNPSNNTFPIFNNNHNQGDRSITGGYVYRGSELNNLQGRYIYGDFASGRVWSLDYNPNTGAANRTQLFDTNFSVSTFGKDTNDELYFAAYGFTGRIYKLVENNNNTPPTTSSCSVTTGNCSININGLNSGEIAKVFDASFQQVWICTPFGNNPNPCNSIETITGLGSGNYFVQACGTTTSFTVNCGSTNPCAGQGGDSDGDGICNNQDCQPFNNAFPATPGTSCNDGNSNTTNDVITSNGCSCAGTSIPTTTSCSVSTGNCSITLNGLNSGDFIKVFDTSFNEIWRCSQFGNGSPCSSTETVTGLSSGNYFVQACGVTESYTVSCSGGSTGGPGSGSGSGGCSVSASNCVITLNGLNSGDFIKVFDSSFNEVWRCSQFGNGSPCNSTETVTGLGSGTFFVQACGMTTPYTLNGCGQGGGGGGNNTPSGNNNCSFTTNIAQGRSTQQSSTISAGGITGSAFKAVDGNTNGNFFTSPAQNSSVAATQNQSQPYWQVDLQSNNLIEEIRVYNRTDGSSRSNNAYVLVSDSPFTSSSLSTSRSQADYEFFISGQVGSPNIVSPNVTGRYVRIQMQGSGFLTLAEVEVMGCPSNSLNSNPNTLITILNSDLLHFDGRKKDRAVELSWVTNMEPLNDFFVLQRSRNGINFQILKEIDSRGNSLDPTFYAELDESPFYGKNYYRLAQTLTDGTVYYSSTYEVEFDIDLNSFVIFPNPAQNEINVNLKSFVGEKAVIQIFDARGILVKTHEVDAASTHPERIELKGLVNGLYLMTVKLEGQKLISKPFSIKNLD